MNLSRKTNDTGFVYRWTNNLNGRWYIGSHKGRINDGYITGGLILKRAILKYGIENFSREILYEGDDFRNKEEIFLNKLNATDNIDSYNLKNAAIGGSFPGSLNGMFDKKMSDETKQKVSTTLKKRFENNPELGLKQSKRMQGKNNPMYGVNRKGTWAIEKSIITKKINRENWGHLKQSRHHITPFREVYRRLVKNGHFASPRNKLVIELENFSYILPPYVRFCNFEHRKLNLNYIKNEFVWYLKGDKFDLSIIDEASLWKTLVNQDGSINSNYGQYIFGKQNQFDMVKRILEDDASSRRASIIILEKSYLRPGAKDVPCTYSINFRIRDNKLNMTVHMRSQDGIFGLGNDAPAFSFLHEMMLNTLKEKYSTLEYGSYYHFVDSFHVYEKHFKMLGLLSGYDKVEGDFSKNYKRRLSSYRMVLCPKINGPEEVAYLRKLDFKSIPDKFAFTKWITTLEKK